MNTNKFDITFDKWLDSPVEYKVKHNPFTEILSNLIKDWPEVEAIKRLYIVKSLK